MLAFFRSGPAANAALGEAMARSLGLFAGLPADLATTGPAIYVNSAQRREAGSWRPHRSPSGLTILVNGCIDNRVQLRAKLGGVAAGDSALYAAAFERWGDDADQQIIGDYCALIEFPGGGDIRLSRSPWRAPPLHFAHAGSTVCAASVPRVLQVCGFAAKLDQANFAASQYAALSGTDGWFEDAQQVGLGQIVTITRGGWSARSYYDHLARRTAPAGSRQDYLAEAERLLDESCSAMLDGFARPGIFLSAGLDSSNVAARLIDALPEGKTLPSFTFRPHPDWRELGFDTNTYGDDWPAVQQFAAMHPRLRTYASSGRADFDDKWPEMFLATGIAPIGMPNMFQYHPLFSEAKRQGCDVIYEAEFGNATFSSGGEWGFTEYLLRGQWRQLARAIRHDPFRKKSPLWTFLTRSIAPLLPDPLWNGLARMIGRERAVPMELVSPLSAAATRRYSLQQKAAPDMLSSRPHLASRAAMMRGLFARGEMFAGDVVQGFEQLYGIKQRDPTSYRPFVEFCLGLPIGMFLHDGQGRWLAREMGKGRMPEAQRLDTRTGLHSPDWHARMTPRLPALRAEILAAQNNPELAALIDIPRMLALIDEWPDKAPLDNVSVMKFGMAIPRAAMMARYARFVSGRNEP